MEEKQNSEYDQTQQIEEPTSFESREGSGVSFPTVGQPKKSGGAKTLLIVGILVLVAILGFVIYKSAAGKSSSAEATPSSFDDLTTPSSEEIIDTSTPIPSSTPAVKVDKEKVQIQVLNGTGIPGEAAYLQTQLGSLGYTNIKVGNSSTTTNTTSVTFSKTLDASVVSEITQKLNSLYQTVETQTSSSATFDVVVTTGLRKGATAKPAASGTPKPSSTTAGSPTPKPSSTPTTKPSATP